MTESEVKDLVKSTTVENARMQIRHVISLLESVLDKTERHEVLLHLEGALMNLRFMEAPEEGVMSGSDEES
jgi:hypothetical protein